MSAPRTGAAPAADARLEEILICLLADRLRGDRHVAVGAASPIPGAAALLARREATTRMDVTVLHSRRFNHFTDGGRELFDCAGQGRVDTFFLGGVQIDGAANINLVGPGAYPDTTHRFAGSFGSAFMYFAVPRIILFREEHSPRTLVGKVDFISAPGPARDGAKVWRRGGPTLLLTGLCAMAFDTATGRFRLLSRHPGVSVATIVAATGFRLDVTGDEPETEIPDAARLAVLRGAVAADVAEFYPDFARRIFDVPARETAR